MATIVMRCFLRVLAEATYRRAAANLLEIVKWRRVGGWWQSRVGWVVSELL